VDRVRQEVRIGQVERVRLPRCLLHPRVSVHGRSQSTPTWGIGPQPPCNRLCLPRLTASFNELSLCCQFSRLERTQLAKEPSEGWECAQEFIESTHQSSDECASTSSGRRQNGDFDDDDEELHGMEAFAEDVLLQHRLSLLPIPDNK